MTLTASSRLSGVALSYTLLLSTPAHAGPPYQTDDPQPAESGHYELYVAYEFERTNDGTAGSLPLVELNYGAAEDLQIGVGLPVAFDNPRTGNTHRGLGDAKLSAKYNFLHESDALPSMSLFPMVVLPTADARKNLGNGDTQFFLPLWLQKNWGAWQTNAGGGYWVDRSPDGKNHWFLGWQLQRRLSSRWSVGGEVFHSTAAAADESASSGFNLGAVFDFDEHNHWLMSMGRGFSNADATNQLSAYVGYQLTW
jgi:hypothetical protein